jgi:hypothetical protein
MHKPPGVPAFLPGEGATCIYCSSVLHDVGELGTLYLPKHAPSRAVLAWPLRRR